MASYQARQQSRGRLLDSKTQAILERRSKELLGMGLFGIGLLTVMMLGSFVPDDPSMWSVTDDPAMNLLGRFGATVASPLFIIIGWASWGIAAVFLVWGARFMFHKAPEDCGWRMIFSPLWVFMLTPYVATLVPSEDWVNYFGTEMGLGGAVGDMFLGALLYSLPIKATLGVKLLALTLAVAATVMGLYVLGVTMPELRRTARFMGVGAILAYGNVMTLLGKGAAGAAKGAAQGAVGLKARRQARLDRKAAAQEAQAADAYDQGYDDDHDGLAYDDYDHDDAVAEDEPKSLRLRLSTLIKRAGDPEPEYHDDHLADPQDPSYEGEDRIKEKITDVIKTRVRQRAAAKATRHEPPVIRGGHASPSDAAAINDPVKEEPPLSAAVAAARRALANASTPRIAAPTIGAAAFTHVADDPQDMAPQDWAPQDMALNGVVADDVVTAGAPVEPAHAPYAPPHAAPTTPAPAPAPMAPPVIISPKRAAEPPLTATRSPAAPQPAAPQPAAMPEPEFVPAPLPEPTPVFRSAGRETPKPMVQHSTKKTAPSKQAVAEAQPQLQFDDAQPPAYETPPLSLLMSPDEVKRHHLSDEALEQNARMLETVLDDYGVKGEIVSVRPGPVVTMYELEPAPGLKASRVIGLADDIARSMSALSARVSTVPGRTIIGIELPNVNREMCVLREVLAARDFGDSNMRLPLALGKDIGGDPVVANLAKMPHLLIAGTTGSGKSVAINTMILSLLYKLTPDECRLIMIDPKMLELSVYDGIPHLLSPVVTDPKKALVALKWTVGEMEERYRKMSKMGVRNIDGYNGRVEDALSRGEMFSRTVQTGFDDDTGEPVFETEEIKPEKLPFIVVIVDEMADLMMVAGKEIEACIQRLAQMARASGIHLIMATQRPSVDVITGTIKANFPTRISFQVTSKIDSRTILGEQGAEQLLGMGDMLYMAGGAKITRVHGPFVSDEEVEEVVNSLKAYGPPTYVSGVVNGPDDDKADGIDAVLGLGGNTDGEDALYDQAVAIVIKDRKCSTSYIQRKLAIGYNKAARLVEQMEDQGVVTSANHVGKREILVPEQ